MKIPLLVLAFLVAGVLTSEAAGASTANTKYDNDNTNADTSTSTIDDQQYWQEFFRKISSPFEEEEGRELRQHKYYRKNAEICAYQGFMQVDYVGKEKCLYRNEAICKDGWQLGIFRKDTSYYLQLRRESSPSRPVYINYKDATELCIGEKRGNLAYLTIKVPSGVHYLAGPNVGNPHKLPRLKIRPQKGGCRGTSDGNRMLQNCDDDEVIVKYRDGAGDDDCLWEILFSGDTRTCPGSLWGFVPNPTSSEPSVLPSSEPSSLPSSQPSIDPTMTTNGNRATVKIACTATNQGTGSVTDCEMIPPCNPMTGTSCEWTLQWNYNVINDSDQDSMLMVLNTTLCHGQCTGGYVLDGGCMEGSSPTCSEEVSVTPGGEMEIPAGQNRRFSIKNWESVDLAMGGIKVYGYVVAMLEPKDGPMLTDHDQSCVYKCHEALASHGVENHVGEYDALTTELMILSQRASVPEKMTVSASIEDDDDSDGVRTPVEIALGTDPMVSDTDGDGASDGEEIAAGTNPLDPEDKPRPVEMKDLDGDGGVAEKALGTSVFEEAVKSEAQTLSPTAPPVASSPTTAPVSPSPTANPVSSVPTSAPVSSDPTSAPASSDPTVAPVSSSPTTSPVSSVPTLEPVSSDPTSTPASSDPTVAPVSSSPTTSPVSFEPTSLAPVTVDPTQQPSSRPETQSPTALPSKMPISIVPTAIPTIKPKTLTPTSSLSESFVSLSEPRNADVPCHVSAKIECSVYHNAELIDCKNFRRASQGNIEIRWSYSVTNQCSYDIHARRAMIMKCHKCPTLLTSNGPNSCDADTTLFRKANDGQAIIIEAGNTFDIVEIEAVDLTSTCDSPLVTSFSRFLALRISAVELDQESIQVTAAQSMGPVCLATYDVWPGVMHQCQSNQVWGEEEDHTEHNVL